VTLRDQGLRSIEGKRQIHALSISGAIDDEELVRRVLIRFVHRRAEVLIPPFARAVCSEIKAQPHKLGVNRRKGAWGICSANGDIHIADRVLFLSPELARQIVLHEAAHLKVLNHSARFYQLLYSYPGSTEELEKAVKKAGIYIPAWFTDGS
jgi:predicted metal-dependent hydrolase